MFAYDGKTDLIAGYHDRSGWARNPDWHAIYSEDSISRVQELLKKGERTVPEPIQKAIDEYFPENVSNTPVQGDALQCLKIIKNVSLLQTNSGNTFKKSGITHVI